MSQISVIQWQAGLIVNNSDSQPRVQIERFILESAQRSTLSTYSCFANRLCPCHAELGFLNLYPSLIVVNDR